MHGLKDRWHRLKRQLSSPAPVKVSREDEEAETNLAEYVAEKLTEAVWDESAKTAKRETEKLPFTPYSAHSNVSDWERESNWAF